MTLELADRSITHPKGVAEDVFVKVGKFHFPTDFVVVDFEADLRVPLILGRSFLRIGRAFIDVYGEEITLRVNDESITFNLNQTIKYSSTYDDTLMNRVDVIDIACEDFVQDVLDFQYNPKSSSPTLVYDDLISESNACKLREKATNQMEKFFQIFYDLHFDISFSDALILMPKFASTIKSLLANKDKLFKLAKVPLNENFPAMLLKKLPEKLRDPGKFLISCDFPGMEFAMP
nr:reverse transcriptase domain-containing protein [Tanacetum cinerariifolium]